MAGVVPDRAPGVWIWLFPLTQFLHGAEESLQGYAFHLWLRNLAHAQFSRSQTLVMHAAFLFATLIAAALARHLARARWVVAALAVLVLLNAVSHIAAAMVRPEAASGFFTSVLLWLPLGTFAMVHAWRNQPRLSFWLGAGAGAAIQIPLTWMAAFSAQL